MKIIKQNDSSGGLIFKQNTTGKAMKQNYNFGKGFWKSVTNNVYIECPAGTITSLNNPLSIVGFIDASDVVGPTAQGMAVGNFGPVVRALKQGVTYVNLHTDKYPGGEIRGQLKIVP